jgi:hypothetical protein
MEKAVIFIKERVLEALQGKISIHLFFPAGWGEIPRPMKLDHSGEQLSPTDPCGGC